MWEVGGGRAAGHPGLGLGDGTTKVWLHNVRLSVLAAHAHAWPLLPMCCLLSLQSCGKLRNECDVA